MLDSALPPFDPAIYEQRFQCAAEVRHYKDLPLQLGTFLPGMFMPGATAGGGEVGIPQEVGTRSTGEANVSSTITFSHTTTSETDDLLVLFGEAYNGRTLTSVAFDGTTLDQIVYNSNDGGSTNTASAGIYVLRGVAAKTANVVITFSGTAYAEAVAINLKNPPGMEGLTQQIEYMPVISWRIDSVASTSQSMGTNGTRAAGYFGDDTQGWWEVNRSAKYLVVGATNIPGTSFASSIGGDLDTELLDATISTRVGVAAASGDVQPDGTAPDLDMTWTMAATAGRYTTLVGIVCVGKDWQDHEAPPILIGTQWDYQGITQNGTSSFTIPADTDLIVFLVDVGGATAPTVSSIVFNQGGTPEENATQQVENGVSDGNDGRAEIWTLEDPATTGTLTVQVNKSASNATHLRAFYFKHRYGTEGGYSYGTLSQDYTFNVNGAPERVTFSSNATLQMADKYDGFWTVVTGGGYAYTSWSTQSWNGAKFDPSEWQPTGLSAYPALEFMMSWGEIGTSQTSPGNFTDGFESNQYRTSYGWGQMAHPLHYGGFLPSGYLDIDADAASAASNDVTAWAVITVRQTA